MIVHPSGELSPCPSTRVAIGASPRFVDIGRNLLLVRVSTLHCGELTAAALRLPCSADSRGNQDAAKLAFSTFKFQY